MLLLPNMVNRYERFYRDELGDSEYVVARRIIAITVRMTSMLQMVFAFIMTPPAQTTIEGDVKT